MKKIAISLFLLSIISVNGFAQDPSFSQPYSNPLYMNPAFAGTGTSQRIGLNFRAEWPNIPGTFIDYSASYDRNIFDSCTGIGVLASQDRAGGATLITNDASLIFSRQIHMGPFTLSVGVQGTFHEKIVDWSKLTFGDQIDATRGFVYNTNELATRSSIIVPDFSAGVLGYAKYYFIGFSVDHFTQPDESFETGPPSPLPIKYTFNAGGMINIGKFVVSPSILYMRQQDFNTAISECYVNYGHFTIGVGMRLQDAWIFTVGFQNKFLRIGYSYDYTISALTEQTGGSHEATLAVLLSYHSAKLKKTNGIHCPLF